MKTRWCGFSGIAETPESPDWSFKGGAVTCVRTFAGPYQKLLASRPQEGQTIPGSPGLTVDETRLKKQRGGKGLLTITLSAQNITTVLAQAEPPTYEVDWVEAQKPLERHSIYATGGAQALTDSDRSMISMWKKGGMQTEQRGETLNFIYYERNGDKTTIFSSEAIHFCRKLLKGQDSYVIYLPICKRTISSRLAPITAKCGTRENPPSGFPSALISAYTWLKTADRGTRSGSKGKWKRTEEWTGVDEIDTDIYPAS